jgi:hypothetical protein
MSDADCLAGSCRQAEWLFTKEKDQMKVVARASKNGVETKSRQGDRKRDEEDPKSGQAVAGTNGSSFA